MFQNVICRHTYDIYKLMQQKGVQCSVGKSRILQVSKQDFSSKNENKYKLKSMHHPALYRVLHFGEVTRTKVFDF